MRCGVPGPLQTVLPRPANSLRVPDFQAELGDLLIACSNVGRETIARSSPLIRVVEQGAEPVSVGKRFLQLFVQFVARTFQRGDARVSLRHHRGHDVVVGQLGGEIAPQNVGLAVLVHERALQLIDLSCT
jgi:hypothetical protein